MSSLIQRMRESFATRIILMLIVTMVVMAAVFDLFLIRMQQQSYEKNVVSDGTAQASILARSVRLGMFSEDRDELARQSNMLLNHSDIKGVFLFTPMGKELFSQENDTVLKNKEIACSQTIRNEIEQAGSAFQQTEDVFIFWQPVFFDAVEISAEALYFTEEELDTGETEFQREIIGYAALIKSKERFKEEVIHIIYRTGLAVLVFLFASTVAIFAVIRKMTRPLKTLLAEVQAHGGQARGNDIDMLLTTYSRLFKDLEESFKTINTFKEGLEDQVAERTRELKKRSKNLAATNEKLNTALQELSAAQDQLVQSEKMAAMGQLVAGVAHEINNTVNFVSGALPPLKRSLAETRQVIERYQQLDGSPADQLSERLAEIEAHKREIDFDQVLSDIELLIANMEEGSRRTTRIVRDLRIFSWSSRETWEEIDLHTALETTITFVHEDLRSGIEIRREYGDIVPVSCQLGRMDQVFLNILTNGMQAMKGRGTMTIRTWKDEDHVHIRFTDTGHGIAGENLSRIFDPFYTSKDVGEGSGLGLGISYSIVKQHGGEITVESKEGMGSVFEVILPIAQNTTK